MSEIAKNRVSKVDLLTEDLNLLIAIIEQFYGGRGIENSSLKNRGEDVEDIYAYLYTKLREANAIEIKAAIHPEG